MKVVGIIQARMGSTRLSGKVLLDIGGKTMLQRVVERASRSTTIDQVVVATTALDRDEPIVEACARDGVACVRGSEDDVLDRFILAAHRFEAEIVVRITSDCPLIDPEVIDEVLTQFHQKEPDYASNTMTRCWPRGLDAEAIDVVALEATGRLASESYERVHVTPYIYGHPDQFRLLPVVGPFNHGDLRWTVDVEEDLAMVRRVYNAFGDSSEFGWREVLDLLKRRPEIADINRGIEQKALHDC